MKYPVLIFEKNDSKMWAIIEPFGHPDLIAQYKSLYLVDSEGYLYYVKELRQVSGVNILKSIQKFGKMVKFDIVYDMEAKQLSIENFKERIMAHVRQKKRFWQSLGTVSQIQELVDNCQTFEDLIRLFR
ncbi:MAG: hypothetical protein JNL70_27500 [Saprospiraceae bacterium]|nr:hypothetical protein [Saprospiraceae bacterium]